MSTVALPGLSRIFRITDVQEIGGTFRILGVVDDRSQLQRGESRSFNLLIDPAQGLAKTSSLDSPVVLQLEGQASGFLSWDCTLIEQVSVLEICSSTSIKEGMCMHRQ
jgi:hypothetical protein